MTSKRTPIEKRGNFLIIPEIHRGERAAVSIPFLTFIGNVGTGVEIWEGPAHVATADGWTIDEILDLIEGPEPVKRAVPAIAGFDEEAVKRSVREALEERLEITLEDDDGDDDDQQVPLREFQRHIHELACEKGWWDGYERDKQGRLKLTTDQVISKIALIHAELSEAVEEARKSDDYCFYFGEGDKPEGFDIELADALIRILDLFGALGLDAHSTVLVKHAYNMRRPHRHGGKLA